jgi:gentisate 1,2-dioxygenase
MSAFRNEAEIDDRQRDVLADASRHEFVPGWHRPGRPPVWPRPNTDFLVARWSYEDAHRILEEAGTLNLENAERRNLIMANPLEGNHYPTVRTLVAAYQMLLPGEEARVHRHSPHAGRLVLDADDGAYTIVDDVPLPMQTGDVLLTPGGSWHGHVHKGDKPAFWLDFLDVPLVQLLEPMFFDARSDGLDSQTPSPRDSLFRFPWETTQERLAVAAPAPDGSRGRRVELGSPALPTIGLFMHQIDAGQTVSPPRTSANYQLCVVQGAGVSAVGEQTVRWQRGDVFTCPTWTTLSHSADEEAVLFEMTDEPLQRYCAYLREEPGN